MSAGLNHRYSKAGAAGAFGYIDQGGPVVQQLRWGSALRIEEKADLRHTRRARRTARAGHLGQMLLTLGSMSRTRRLAASSSHGRS